MPKLVPRISEGAESIFRSDRVVVNCDRLIGRLIAFRWLLVVLAKLSESEDDHRKRGVAAGEFQRVHLLVLACDSHLSGDDLTVLPLWLSACVLV